MRGLLVRERQSAWNSLSGLENTGTLSILPLQKEMLTDSLLLSLTYWVSFADLFEAGGMDDGSAQVNAIARVMMLVSPYLREQERERFIALAEEYLAAG